MDGTTDVSKKTVLVLLVITVLVSVVGTWTVLNSLSSSNVEWTAQSQPAGGEVSLNVIAPAAPMEPSIETGNVVFNVLPNN